MKTINYNYLHTFVFRLDILVNNAGAGYSDTNTVTNGLPTIMLTNYFGPFLLTNLLLGKYTPDVLNHGIFLNCEMIFAHQ